MFYIMYKRMYLYMNLFWSLFSSDCVALTCCAIEIAGEFRIDISYKNI
jgi:hypothetical protein